MFGVALMLLGIVFKLGAALMRGVALMSGVAFMLGVALMLPTPPVMLWPRRRNALSELIPRSPNACC